MARIKEQKKREDIGAPVAKRRFYETRTGSFLFVLLAIVIGYIVIRIGAFGEDTTLCIEGFAVAVTALLYTPLRTFLFDKIERMQ